MALGLAVAAEDVGDACNATSEARPSSPTSSKTAAADLVVIAAVAGIVVVVGVVQDDRGQSTKDDAGAADAASAGHVRPSADVVYVAETEEVAGVASVVHAGTGADIVAVCRGAASEVLEEAVAML